MTRNSQYWRSQYWWLALGAIFLFQFVVLFLLGSRRWPEPKYMDRPTQYMTVTDPGHSSVWSKQLDVRDPTIFSLASREGFSGAIGAGLWNLNHELDQWRDQDRWWTNAPSELGLAFHRFMGTNVLPRHTLAANPQPPLANIGIAEEKRKLETSWLEFWNGPSLPLRGPPPSLPVWSLNDVLSPTVVDTKVDRSGYVFSSTLLESSGVPEADQEALRIARSLRFERMEEKATNGPTPEAPADLINRRLIFHWATVPSEEGLALEPVEGVDGNGYR